MKLVVDASVAIKWFVGRSQDEPYLAQAEAVGTAIGRGGTQLFAPSHWIAEVIAVLAQVDGSTIDDALLLLDDMRPVLVTSVSVLRRAADLSISLNHHLFDTLYHAVALEQDAALVTADEAYFAKARHLGSIELLADFAM